MKKKIVLIFVLLLAVFTLTACNKKVSELVNETLDIIVSGEGLTKDMEVVVEIIDDATTKAKDFIGKLVEEAFNKDKDSKIYDIAITDKKIKIQPNGEVEVKLPKLEGVERHKVYHEKEDGDVEEIPCEEDGDYIKFKTRKFSLFALCAADGTDIYIFADKGGALAIYKNGVPLKISEYQDFYTMTADDSLHFNLIAYDLPGYKFTEWKISNSKNTDYVTLSKDRYLDIEINTLKDNMAPFIDFPDSIYFRAAYEAINVRFGAYAQTLEGGDILVDNVVADTGNGYQKDSKIDEKVTVTARPKEGYVFVGWFSDTEGQYLLSTNKTETFTMDSSNLLVYAHFAKEAVSLVLDSANAGFIDGVATYTSGAYVRPDLVLVSAKDSNNETRYLYRHEYDIDFGGLDFSKAGTYTITYTYKRDTTVSATLTVIVV